ncbi:hypothetical protein EBX31_13545, partial [bacterium]|nr:hypothetical protein [bacterium]
TNNLPDFSSRSGAMAAGAYISNIAASILDYIDTDTECTVDSVGVSIANQPALPPIPTWRGGEAIAWPNELFTRFHFETSDTKAVAGGFQYSFKYKHYLEVWNICNRDVPLVNLILNNNRSFLVRIAPLTFNLTNSTFGAVAPLLLTPVAGSPANLKPGEFGMLESPTMTLRFTHPNATATDVQFQDWNQNYSVISSTNSVTKSTRVISATKMGQLLYNKDIKKDALYGPVNGVIFATSLGYACQSTYRAGPPNLKSIGGDPRAQLFLGTWPTKGQLYVKYSSPGGLNWEEGNSGFANGYVNAQDLWPDRGIYKPSDNGVSPQTYSSSPEDYYNGKKNKWSTNVALCKFNNTGKFTNICELGSIFDPMQWEDSSQLPTAAGGMPGLWTNLSANATKANTACGRTTLRIGRPEFTRFAFTNLGGSKDLAVPNMGQSAVALLDIFCATNALDDGGKININT